MLAGFASRLTAPIAAFVFFFENGIFLLVLFCLAFFSFICILFLGADSLCGRLNEKLTSTHNHKLVLAHMPLLMVCLEVSTFFID